MVERPMSAGKLRFACLGRTLATRQVGEIDRIARASQSVGPQIVYATAPLTIVIETGRPQDRESEGDHDLDIALAEAALTS